MSAARSSRIVVVDETAWRRDLEALRARRNTRGRWENEGRRRLVAAKDFMTDEAIARSCGLSRMQINNYANGVTRPELDDMLRLELALGIPVTAWLVSPKNTNAKLLCTTLPHAEPTVPE